MIDLHIPLLASIFQLASIHPTGGLISKIKIFYDSKIQDDRSPYSIPCIHLASITCLISIFFLYDSKIEDDRFPSFIPSIHLPPWIDPSDTYFISKLIFFFIIQKLKMIDFHLSSLPIHLPPWIDPSDTYFISKLIFFFYDSKI